MARESTKKSRKGRASPGILDSAQEIWLAGVGAFAKAQQEGEKVFRSLVRKGREVEARQHQRAGESGLHEGTRRELSERVEEAREKASVGWERFEHLLEERLSRALDRFGVARKSDLEALSRRIDRLDKTLKERPKGGEVRTTAKRPGKAGVRTAKKRP